MKYYVEFHIFHWLSYNSFILFLLKLSQSTFSVSQTWKRHLPEEI